MNVNTVVIGATQRVQRLLRATCGHRGVSVAPAAATRWKAATIAPWRVAAGGEHAAGEAP